MDQNPAVWAESSYSIHSHIAENNMNVAQYSNHSSNSGSRKKRIMVILMQIRNNYDNKDNYNSNTETILAHQSNII